MRDPESLLAALCRDSSPFRSEADGVVFIDRDWWGFRHVLEFLRCGRLPRSRAALRSLLQDAEFYRLPSLSQALRERYVNWMLNRF